MSDARLCCGQTNVSRSLCTGIVAYNPLLALLLDIARCEFSGTSARVKLYLVLSIAAYGSAIGVLSQIPSGGGTGSASGSASAAR